jgi:hypothetical protein
LFSGELEEFLSKGGEPGRPQMLRSSCDDTFPHSTVSKLEQRLVSQLNMTVEVLASEVKQGK